MMVSSNI